MNILKNMEAIFLVAVATVSATGFATASSAPAPVERPAVTEVVDANMTVVVHTHKRLTAAEKAAL